MRDDRNNRTFKKSILYRNPKANKNIPVGMDNISMQHISIMFVKLKSSSTKWEALSKEVEIITK